MGGGGGGVNDLFPTINADYLISCYENIIEGLDENIEVGPFLFIDNSLHNLL